jgi:hypothetical protein
LLGEPAIKSLNHHGNYWDSPQLASLFSSKMSLLLAFSRNLITLSDSKTLADIRNDAAHGYSFDGFPWTGLMELVRDLIEYAYRDLACMRMAV